MLTQCPQIAWRGCLAVRRWHAACVLNTNSWRLPCTSQPNTQNWNEHRPTYFEILWITVNYDKTTVTLTPTCWSSLWLSKTTPQQEKHGFSRTVCWSHFEFSHHETHQLLFVRTREYLLLRLSTTVPAGMLGRVCSGDSLLVSSLAFLFFERLTKPSRTLLFTGYARIQFGAQFAPQPLNMTASNQPQVYKICKDSSSKCTHKQESQKDLAWDQVKPMKLSTCSSFPFVSSNVQHSPNKANIGAKMKLVANQSQNKSSKTSIQKKTKTKSCSEEIHVHFCCHTNIHFRSQWDTNETEKPEILTNLKCAKESIQSL